MNFYNNAHFTKVLIMNNTLIIANINKFSIQLTKKYNLMNSNDLVNHYFFQEHIAWAFTPTLFLPSFHISRRKIGRMFLPVRAIMTSWGFSRNFGIKVWV